MSKFYLTFPQKHPDKDSYRVIEAPDMYQAKCEALDLFGTTWANIYKDGDGVRADLEFYFKEGQLGATIIARKWKTDGDYKEEQLNQPI